MLFLSCCRLLDNFSASDMRGVSVEKFDAVLEAPVTEFLKTQAVNRPVKLVSCSPSSTLEEVEKTHT